MRHLFIVTSDEGDELEKNKDDELSIVFNGSYNHFGL